MICGGKGNILVLAITNIKAGGIGSFCRDAWKAKEKATPIKRYSLSSTSDIQALSLPAAEYCTKDGRRITDSENDIKKSYSA
jgi:hypothetical protein